ncbi:helix-turn-helix domain-containing protein [Synechocystis salina]|uniref:helix-turn-helix domain-containing protein n=1 Tax=Synechocystis salina TaxID=945780 RepID=UPI0039083940
MGDYTNLPVKLKLTRQQNQEIDNIFEVCRRVYNFALSERKHWLNSRKSRINSCSIISEYILPADTPYPSYNNQAKALTIAKQSNESLRSVNA